MRNILKKVRQTHYIYIMFEWYWEKCNTIVIFLIELSFTCSWDFFCILQWKPKIHNSH